MLPRYEIEWRCELRVVVTGVMGFVGRNLSAYLADKGVEVWGVEVGALRSSAAECSVSSVQCSDGYCSQRTDCNDEGKRAGTGPEQALGAPRGVLDTEVQQHDIDGAGRGKKLNTEYCILNTGSACAKHKLSRMYGWEELGEIPWGEVDAVVHLAGKAHDTRNTSDEQSYFEVNEGLTKRVVEALSNSAAECSVFSVQCSDEDGMERGVGTTKNTKDHKIFRHDYMRGHDCMDRGGSSDAQAHLGTIRPTSQVCGSELELGDGKGELDTEVQRYDIDAGGVDRGKRVSAGQHHSAARGGIRFVLFSSVKAVADSVDGVLDEGAVAEPKTAYGRSKLAAEEVLLSSTSKQRREVVPYVLRPAMIHGLGNKGNLNLLYKVVRWGIPWPLGAFENERSFASIENVCAVVYEMISGAVELGVYQVADDETLSTNRLIELMAERVGRKARIWRLPVGLMRWLARVGDVLRLPLNSERLKKLTESYVVGNAKVKRALGWERMPVGAVEGMRKTLGSFIKT